MKTLLGTLLIAFALTVAYGYAVADTPVPASQPAAAAAASVEATPDVGGLIGLFKDHQWRPAIAGVLTLLVFFWRRYAGSWLLGKIPSRHVPWVVALVGLAAALPAALSATPFVWYKFLLDGLLIGAEAVLFWSTLGKIVLPKIFGNLQ